MFSDCNPPRFPLPGRAAHLDSEADNPVREQTASVYEEIHHVGVVGVLHAAKPRLDHGEASLHEHDQEAGDQRPDEVDGDLVLADLVGHVADGEASLGIGHGHVVDGARDRAPGIAVGMSSGGGRRGKGVLQLGSRRGRCGVSPSHSRCACHQQ